MVVDAYGQAGSVDVSFNSTDIGFGYGDAINGGGVTCMLEQPDGKILLGGDFFTKYSNLSRNRVVRLQSNGSVDLTPTMERS
jgi:hypothetical protein